MDPNNPNSQSDDKKVIPKNKVMDVYKIQFILCVFLIAALLIYVIIFPNNWKSPSTYLFIGIALATPLLLLGNFIIKKRNGTLNNQIDQTTYINTLLSSLKRRTIISLLILLTLLIIGKLSTLLK